MANEIPRYLKKPFQLQFRVGLASAITSTQTKNSGIVGEPFWATDERGLYVHDGERPVAIGGQALVNAIATFDGEILTQNGNLVTI